MKRVPQNWRDMVESAESSNQAAVTIAVLKYRPIRVIPHAVDAAL